MGVDSQNAVQIITDYQEQFRPQFHFTPQEKWMNDPNGLVYHQGIYHLFYQYYPEDIVWGPMHWGHAISKDMVSWEHKRIALFPDKLGFIFSGSAVVDVNNSSGFGTAEHPPLVAIFSYHLMEGEKAGRSDFQTQGIAYSLDNGESWTKYDGNPVIGNTDIRDFRDPKVFWHEASSQWILALVAGDHVQFYASQNLKSWNFISDFGKKSGAHGGVWECPDLFKINIEDSEEEKWVLLVSINPGAPNGGSGTQYFVGNFDGKNFIADHAEEKWIDLGADNYAGVTYNNTQDDERIFIGWMSNWNYAQKTPTETWRSAMTLPRKLSLVEEDGTYFLRSKLLTSFDSLLTEVSKRDTVNLQEIFTLEHPNFNQTEIRFTTRLSDDILMELSNEKEESLIIAINPSLQQISVDRRKSGLINFEDKFAEKKHILSYNPSDKEVNVRIILDWSSVEIFIDEGKYVMTEQIFPTSFYKNLRISSLTQTTIKDFNLYNIKSIW